MLMKELELRRHIVDKTGPEDRNEQKKAQTQKEHRGGTTQGKYIKM